MTTIEVIKFDGLPEGKPWVAYKYPKTDFLMGTQLVVNPSQEAVFVKGGELCDVFGAGTYTLATENLPSLSRFIKKSFGGKTPFSAEIFFVNRSSKLDMTWGTATPFQLEDPRYGIIVSIRAHGKYGLKITNSGLFVGNLVGSVPSETVFSYSFINAYFNGMLMAHIKSTISSFMIREKWSFLEVTAYLAELSRECNLAAAKEFEQYGIELSNLCIETISPPPTDYEALKKAKEACLLREHGLSVDRQSMGADSLESIPYPVESEVKNARSWEIREDGVGGAEAQEPVRRRTVICPQCLSDVPETQKFCGECGARMGKTCSVCGTVWGATQKFCGECGTKL